MILDLPSWSWLVIYILAPVMMLLVYCWRMGWNPISAVLDYRENKRLEEAAKLGLTWKEYKEKHKL